MAVRSVESAHLLRRRLHDLLRGGGPRWLVSVELLRYIIYELLGGFAAATALEADP